MGSIASALKCNKGAVGDEVVKTAQNPFATNFTKKERILLKDTWGEVKEAKEIVGEIFLEIIDVTPEIRPVFGVQRVPRVAMLNMPKLGGHVARFVEYFDQVTSLLGFMDNPLGTLQLVRKVARYHATVPFLQTNMGDTNYFELVASHALKRLLPHLSPDDSNPDKKKVRFASYTAEQVETVWDRFMSILVEEMTSAFEAAVHKQTSQQSMTALAPQQIHEQQEKRKQKELEKRKTGSNEASSSTENQKPKEELYEDPF